MKSLRTPSLPTLAQLTLSSIVVHITSFKFGTSLCACRLAERTAHLAGYLPSSLVEKLKEEIDLYAYGAVFAHRAFVACISKDCIRTVLMTREFWPESATLIDILATINHMELHGEPLNTKIKHRCNLRGDAIREGMSLYEVMYKHRMCDTMRRMFRFKRHCGGFIGTYCHVCYGSLDVLRDRVLNQSLAGLSSQSGSVVGEAFGCFTPCVYR